MANGSSIVPHMVASVKQWIDEGTFDDGGWKSNANVTKYLVVVRGDDNGECKWGLFEEGSEPDYCVIHRVSSDDSTLLKNCNVGSDDVWDGGTVTYLLFAHYADGDAVMVEL